MSELASDAIWGAAAISQRINRTKAQTFHLLEAGRLPARKVGGKWMSSESALRAFTTIEQPSKSQEAT
jgi:hypothetical protein